MTVNDLFSLNHSFTGPWLRTYNQPWAVLPSISQIIGQITAQLPSDFHERLPGVWVGQGTSIEDSALIQGPAIIGRRCRIRHNAFIRNQVILGDQVVVGNATEVKNAILFDEVQVPHFNYVGDSILGYKVHLGAGAILSNYKSTGDEIHAYVDHQKVSSGLRKFGALIGDRSEIGCNAVLYPGTIIGPDSIIYPLQGVRGTFPARHIQKADGTIVARQIREEEE